MKNTPQQDLKFFFDTGSVLDYCVSELLSTLKDDLNERQEEEHEEQACIELEGKISDIESVSHLVTAIPEIQCLLDSAASMDAALNSTGKAPDGDDYNKLFEIIVVMREALSPNEQPAPAAMRGPG